MIRCVSSVLVSLVAASPLFAQESAAVLHAPLVLLDTDSAPFQKLGDFDGDGDLDVVGTRQHQSGQSGQIRVWRNDGGALTPVFTASVGGNGQVYGDLRLAVEVVDLNGDGRDDITVASRDRVTRLVAQPNFQFVSQTVWLVNAVAGSRALASGDFDADGLVDVAVAAPSNSIDYLYVFFGSGAWTTYTVATPFSSQSAVRLLTLELDGQPGDDLLLFEHGSPLANAYNVVAGQVVHQQQFFSSLASISPSPWLWTGGDVDNDGDDDLVVFKPAYTNSQVPQFEVFRRTGAAAYLPEPSLVGGPAEYLQDVDGDGDLDGVCCGGGGGGGPYYTWPKLDFRSTFEVALNDGSGGFAEAFQFPGAGSESLAGVADLDLDGDLDFVAGRCVFYGDGPWNEPPMPLAAGPQGHDFARRRDLFDVDRDGDPDYWSATNDGDGFFADAGAEPPASPGSVYVDPPLWCDVDGDGVRDRIRRQAGQVAGLVWHRNNGGGHFEHRGLVAPAGMTFHNLQTVTVDTFFVGDFDGDGDEDVYVQGVGDLFWNQNGSFSATPESLQVFGYINGLGDFNSDGFVDVAIYALNSQRVMLGTGQQGNAFVDQWHDDLGVPLGYEPEAALVEDFNGDGLVDILRPGQYVNPRLWINLTQPSGPLTFTAYNLPSSTLALASPSAVGELTITVGDFNGDGAKDLGISRLNQQPNTYSVLLRSSTDPNVHSYQEVLFAIENGHAADVDGDGDTDLIGNRVVRSRAVERTGGGRRVQRHDGVVGENGAAPVLGGMGPYRPGGSHTLHLTGVPGPAVALLGISIGEAYLVDNPLPGLTLYLDPSWLLVGPMPITQSGQGRAAAMATAALPIFPGTEGWTFHLQAFVPDAQAPSLYTQSNLLSLRVGN